MFGRIAELLGVKRRQDAALAKRFARIRKMYDEAQDNQSSLTVVNAMRTGYNLRTVVGAEKLSGETLRKNLLDSYARSLELTETVRSK